MKAEGQTLSAATIWLRLAFVVLAVLGSVGCKPKIGEDCATSTDCSLSGDRLCDITQPGGYCTVFNCEPNQCPADSACVAFSEGTCSTASTRFRRTFCMRTCEDDDDCRGGNYRCLDFTRDPSRRIVDTNSSARICAVPSTTSAPFGGADGGVIDPPVCFPSDASFDVSRPETGPRQRDAPLDSDAREPADGDGSDDRGDASDEASAPDAAGDGDSSHGETGTDVASDSADDVEPDVEDVTTEPLGDATPDDASDGD
jgi:hypothetical protein